MDEHLEVDRAPIRALAKVAVKARRAFDEAAKQAAQQGAQCLPPAPAAAGCPAREPEAAPKRPPPLGWLPAGGVGALRTTEMLLGG